MTDRQLSREQQAVLDDLLREKDMAAIYKTSRDIPFSTTNLIIGFVAFVFCFSLSLAAGSATEIVDQLVGLAGLAFNTSIGLLGFLLAGFSFFATVGDRSLFFRMAENPHKGSGLSFLKYNFFSFMRVFVEYFVFCLAALTITLALDPKSGCRKLLIEHFGDIKVQEIALDKLAANAVLSSMVAAFVYLLMQLKSFIYNIYHIVMTSIYWELLQSYEGTDVFRPSEDTAAEESPDPIQE